MEMHLRKPCLGSLLILVCTSLSFACQNKAPFDLDFSGSRLEVIISGLAYSSESTFTWGNVSTSAPIVVNGTLRNRSAFAITMAGTPAITLSGSHASDITLTQPANSIIPAGATESFSFTITPQVAFSRAAKLTIVTTPGNETYTLNLAGYRYGTVLLKDINPGAASAAPAGLIVINSTLYFRADNGTNGIELWKSDASPAGTVMIRDINPGIGSSSPGNFTSLGSSILFAAADGSLGRELWKTDGTSDGTVLVRDINSGAADSSPDNSPGASFAVLNGNVYFQANTAAAGDELWKSDGTFAGTQLILDLNAGISHGNYRQIFTHSATRILFQGRDTTNGREVFKSDGTVGNISLVQDLNAGTSFASPQDFFSINGNTVFRADNGTSDRLWKITSGSATSITQVENVIPSYFTALGTNLIFAGDDGVNGQELWISDSGLDSAGTSMLKNIAAGANSDSVT